MTFHQGPLVLSLSKHDSAALASFDRLRMSGGGE